jgi:hypothetical protein
MALPAGIGIHGRSGQRRFQPTGVEEKKDNSDIDDDVGEIGQPPFTPVTSELKGLVSAATSSSLIMCTG